MAEQSWSVHDHIQNKKRNRLSKERVDKLVFTANNLQAEQRMAKSSLSELTDYRSPTWESAGEGSSNSSKSDSNDDSESHGVREDSEPDHMIDQADSSCDE